MFPSSSSVFPPTSPRAMLGDQNKKPKGSDHRYYDSYRPPLRLETSSNNRSPTLATGSEAVRHQSNKSWHRAKHSSSTTSLDYASLTPKSSHGQSQECSPLAASVPDDRPPSTSHDPEHLTKMPYQQRKATSKSSPAVDAENETHESEAQSRGFYSPSRPSRPRPSNAMTLAGFELKRRQDDGETDRSPKRSRGDGSRRVSQQTTPPPTQLNISPLDPRQRRGSALSPLVLPTNSLRMSPEPGEIPPDEPQMLGTPPSNPSQHRPFGVGVSPSQASVLQEHYQSPPSGQREAYVPPTAGRTENHPTQTLSQREETPSQAPTRNEDPALPGSTPNELSAGDTAQARMNALNEEQRAKQKEFEEGLARKAEQQNTAHERELEEGLNQRRRDADKARQALAERQDEKHEERMTEMRRVLREG